MARKARPSVAEALSPQESPEGVDQGNGNVAVLEGAPVPKGARRSKAKEEADVRGIIIPRPNIRIMRLPIVGTTSLIVHSWSRKAIKMLLDRQQKKAQQAKEARDPDADYEASKYVGDDGWEGIPAVAFKAAIVGACRQVDGLTMTLAKRLAFIQPDGFSTEQNIELTKIEGRARMRQDMVRVASGTADVRFRAEYQKWRATLLIEYNAQVITQEQLINLVSIAGYSEGVGEWRPSAPESATGTHGRWRVLLKNRIEDDPLEFDYDDE